MKFLRSIATLIITIAVLSINAQHAGTSAGTSGGIKNYKSQEEKIQQDAGTSVGTTGGIKGLVPEKKKKIPAKKYN